MRRVAHLLGRSAATLICVAGVPALVVTLVRWLFDVRISAFRPLLNDEVTFWHQALTFSRAGFHGGYYTLGEVTNPSGFTDLGSPSSTARSARWPAGSGTTSSCSISSPSAPPLRSGCCCHG